MDDSVRKSQLGESDNRGRAIPVGDSVTARLGDLFAVRYVDIFEVCTRTTPVVANHHTWLVGSAVHMCGNDFCRALFSLS